MLDLILPSSGSLPVPTARVPITIRPAVLSDIPFMDSLQKMHSKQVGFFPTAQFEGNIRQGRVLIAEEVGGGSEVEGWKEVAGLQPTTHDLQPTPIGYILAADRYFKHDDVGIIYQMNVKPGRQRSLVGAMLLKAQFERSAYGCKLYCCWCAQDIAANKFWEAMGFVPLAFRTGSEKKSRIHIFWQKRIRQGDTTTPWWFPSETSGGAVRGNRIVLPIPPGTHWSDAKPLVLPGQEVVDPNLPKLPKPKKPREPKVKIEAPVASTASPGGLRFGPAVPIAAPAEKIKKEPKPKTTNDPQLVAAARELRDRWLEQIDAAPLMGCGKYEVTRSIDSDVRVEMVPARQLTAA